MQLAKTSVPVAGTVSRQIDPEQTELEDDSIPRSATIRIGRPDSNSIRKWRADSKISNRPHMPCAVISQTTLTHCSSKTSTFAPFVRYQQIVDT